MIAPGLIGCLSVLADSAPHLVAAIDNNAMVTQEMGDESAHPEKVHKGNSRRQEAFCTRERKVLEGSSQYSTPSEHQTIAR